ncbi:MAG: M23/M56 family metallopeptidase, partial [Pseudomonadota bacterium]
MSPIQSEAIFFCMLASLLWAPVVYVIASAADRKQSAVMSEKIWMLALAAAIAPTFVAPVLSVAGVSLRSAPQVAAWTSAIETMITPPTVFKPAAPPPGESAQEYWTPAPSVIEAELGGAMSAAAARADKPARKSAPDDAAKRAQGGAALQETPEEGVITLTMTTRADGASALSPGAIPPESRFSDGARTPLAPRDKETAASPLDDSAYAGAGAAQDFVARGFESRVSATTIANLTGLLYVYGALMAALLWLLKSGAFFIRFLGAQPVADSALLEAVERRRQALGIRRRVRIKQSSKLTSVCVYGYFMPSILIPSGLLRRAAHDDLEMMCAHELAHVKRGDVSLFTLGALLRVIFWFNPFVKAIAGRLELAAEQGADDLVVANGVSKRAYAACFIEGLRYAIASRSQQDRANLSSQLGPILTPSFTPQDRKGRRKRLDGILAAGHGASLKTSTKMLLGGVSVIASAAVFAQASLAVSPQAQADGAIGAIALPVDGAIMKGFGALGPDYDPGKPHQGVDIRAKRGADVRTPREGVVVDVIDNGANGWGKTVLIDHGAGLKTRYAHLDSYAVSKGAVLRAGQVIGKVGSTGEATRAHLHFETIVDGVAADPMILVNADKVAIEPSPAPKATPEPDPAPEPQSAPEPEPAAEPEPAPKNLITVSGKVKTRVAPNDVIADAIGDTADAIAEAIADAIDEAKDGILDEATLGADLAEE